MKTKVVRPAKFNGAGLTGELVAGVEKLAKDIKKDLQDTTKTWNHQPNFTVDVTSTPKKIEIDATTDDPVYTYIDKGTRVRHALMSRDFQAKTQPASGGVTHLSSRRGRGRVLVVSRNIVRPGIKARGFIKAILQSRQRGLTQRMEKHLADGVKKSGHKL